MSGVGFVRTALAHGNMWLEKREDERVGDEGLLIPGWPRGHPWCGTAGVLQSVTKDKNC